MPGTIESNGPAYISFHSADVILSDIRPIKLKAEALRSVNVLLDEFLYSILSTARSLSTDKLRAGLLRVLPTNLGKEALLEAEVELRAYWDRTSPSGSGVSPPEDDAKTFHLQWAFELLRLKCEAYCTLNESDDDLEAETRLHDKMRLMGAVSPPKTNLIAPAALYLTAVLESMCEHILSNVGRVASRDSSSTSATVQDLFVALCEDDSIYGLFKSMKVYEQIELLSKSPKPRRSKSFSRSDKVSSSRTSSPLHDPSSSGKESGVTSTARSRISSDASPMSTMVGTAPTSTSGSRSSFDKGRAMKMFSRTSNDRDWEGQGHKRSESVLSEDTKQTLTAYNESEKPDLEPQDAALLQEFDNLMRSDSTLKVSLTPDRLKTMEHYKQEKDQRGNRRPAPLLFGKTETAPAPVSVPSRGSGRHPSLRHVDSIIEDEEEAFKASPSSNRSRQAGVTSSPSTPPTSSSASGNRVPPGSASSQGVAIRPLIRKSSLSAATPLPISPPTVSSSPMTQTREGRVPKALDDGNFPSRTRKIQRNRESLDLDDVMGGSDDEAPEPAAQVQLKTPTPKRKGQYAVSAKTRDLMDFLADGPPTAPPVSRAGREMIDFLAEGPPVATESAVSLETSKSKGSGRLQRMVSKLTMGNSGKSRSIGGSEDLSRSSSRPPTTPIRATLPSKTSASNLSALANRPIPPRPRPISPPSSPSPSQGSVEEKSSFSPPSRKTSVTRKVMPTWEQMPSETQPTVVAPAVPSKTDGPENIYSPQKPFEAQLPSTNGHANNGANEEPIKSNVLRGPKPPTTVAVIDKTLPTTVESATEFPLPKRLSPKNMPTAIQVNPTRKSSSTIIPSTSSSHLSADDARDMRRHFSNATNVDECRLILDMFLAKSGISVEPTEYDIPYPSPSPSDTPRMQRTEADISLEHALVELFLGGDLTQEQVVVPRERRSQKSKPEEVTVSMTDLLPHGINGNALAQETQTYTPAVVEVAT